MDPNSPAHQLVGAVFNRRWKLGRLVGEGGMGAVYEAQGLGGEGTRAIKVLHPEFVAEEQILTRFIAEAEAVRTLQHPNVAQIFDHGRAEDGTPYLIMELLSGMPLSGLCQPGKPVPPPQAITIMVGVLSALQIAHARGVVHRDLKPDNLFLVPDGRGNHLVKVLDFGIAKVMDAAGGMGSKTKTGVLLGTPGYMSPEQIKNSKGVDPRSDLWSVGIIFYEMLTGREAYPADNEFTRLTMVLTKDVQPIAEVAPHLAHWSAFFQRALSKDVNHRFQSAAEMSQALQSMLQGKSQSASGRDMGTVALNVPSPGSAGMSGAPGAPGQHHPSAHPPPMSHGAFNPMSSPAMGPSTMGSPGVGPHSYGQQPTNSGHHHPQGIAHQSHPPPAITYAASPSAPPPSMPQSGPSTHVSMLRPAGVPTLAQGSGGPAVQVMSAPPQGVPWWVVGAVGVACFLVGFLVGYIV